MKAGGDKKINTDVMFSSKTPEWATPQDLFDRLDEKYHFNLDPASTDENAKCENHFTAKDDGLSREWGGIKCSVTLPMDEKSVNGSRKVIKNLRSRILQ